MQAIRRLDRFDRRRRFAPWLGAIVANRAIDWLRARTARRESGQEPPESAAAADPPAGGLFRRGADRAGRALSRASRGGGDALRARVHARRDRPSTGPAAWHRQLAAATRPRHARVPAREGASSHERATGTKQLPRAGGGRNAGRGHGRWSATLTGCGSPSRRRRSHRRLLLAPAIAILLAAVTLSPAGATVGRLDPSRARRPARRAGVVPAARIGKRARVRRGRDVDRRGRRVEPAARPLASGELVSSRAVRRGCTQRRARGGGPARHASLGARPTGRARPPLVCPDGLSGRVPVGRHAASGRRRRNRRPRARHRHRSGRAGLAARQQLPAGLRHPRGHAGGPQRRQRADHLDRASVRPGS